MAKEGPRDERDVLRGVVSDVEQQGERRSQLRLVSGAVAALRHPGRVPERRIRVRPREHERPLAARVARESSEPIDELARERRRERLSPRATLGVRAPRAERFDDELVIAELLRHQVRARRLAQRELRGIGQLALPDARGMPDEQRHEGSPIGRRALRGRERFHVEHGLRGGRLRGWPLDLDDPARHVPL